MSPLDRILHVRDGGSSTSTSALSVCTKLASSRSAHCPSPRSSPSGIVAYMEVYLPNCDDRRHSQGELLHIVTLLPILGWTLARVCARYRPRDPKDAVPSSARCWG